MTAATESTRDRVVALRRRFRAQRAFLFKAWTDPAYFARWFGPKPWTVEKCQVDARPGGTWNAWLKRPDGTTVHVGGVYSEVERDTRLVFSWEVKSESEAARSLSVVTIEFGQEADGVEICLTHRELITAQAVDMDAGWNSTFDSLEDFISAESASPPCSPSQENKR